MKFKLVEELEQRIDNYNNTHLDIVPFNYTMKTNGVETPIQSYIIVAKGHNSTYGDMDIVIYCLDDYGKEINFKSMQECKDYLDRTDLELKSEYNRYILQPKNIIEDDELDEQLLDERFVEQKTNNFVEARRIAKEYNGKIYGPELINGSKVFIVKYRN